MQTEQLTRAEALFSLAVCPGLDERAGVLLDTCVQTFTADDLDTTICTDDHWFRECVDALNRCSALAMREDELGNRLYARASGRLATLGLYVAE